MHISHGSALPYLGSWEAIDSTPLDHGWATAELHSDTYSTYTVAGWLLADNPSSDIQNCTTAIEHGNAICSLDGTKKKFEDMYEYTYSSPSVGRSGAAQNTIACQTGIMLFAVEQGSN
jgi:hypothetical protein